MTFFRSSSRAIVNATTCTATAMPALSIIACLAGSSRNAQAIAPRSATAMMQLDAYSVPAFT
jgi:hypothetical protein